MASILHPTDLTETSLPAFRHALWFAALGGHELVILHTSGGDASNTLWSSFPKVREQLAEWKVISADLPKSELLSTTGIKIRKIDMVGTNAAESVLGYLEHHTADLIVTGSHVRSGMDSWIHPSVTDRLIAHINQPLLVVKEGLEGFATKDAAARLLNRVLVPVDRTPDPQVAVDLAATLPILWNLQVAAIDALHAGSAPLDPPVIFNDCITAIHRALEISGDPVPAILSYCGKHNPDLVVMTRAGPAGLREKFLGSTTQQLIPRLNCPILLIPEPAYK